ncbi:MAG: type II toxin-antitoxin system RelE/ParE family toxin [Rhodocyclaceae bacterium]|jgi:plasmid stabilization system protein ParE|nr:type II toxin-antitoxin system RelE/ParE family toxin [Rhodocyclaceae bacterium]
MAAKRTPVRLAANFEANLAQIEAYLAEAETPQAYDELLDVLLETVIPNLERHPRMGRPLLDRPAQSVEGRDAIDRLRKQIAGGELREYLTGDYLILYALIREFVILLSIKHHRQLSFDLEKHWP